MHETYAKVGLTDAKTNKRNSASEPAFVVCGTIMYSPGDTRKERVTFKILFSPELRRLRESGSSLGSRSLTTCKINATNKIQNLNKAENKHNKNKRENMHNKYNTKRKTNQNSPSSWLPNAICLFSLSESVAHSRAPSDRKAIFGQH